MEPFQQIGFFCSDPKISFKYTGDTISMGLLIGLSVSLPLIVVSTLVSVVLLLLLILY